jgi:hypothetical protein
MVSVACCRHLVRSQMMIDVFYTQGFVWYASASLPQASRVPKIICKEISLVRITEMPHLNNALPRMWMVVSFGGGCLLNFSCRSCWSPCMGFMVFPMLYCVPMTAHAQCCIQVDLLFSEIFGSTLKTKKALLSVMTYIFSRCNNFWHILQA